MYGVGGYGQQFFGYPQMIVDPHVSNVQLGAIFAGHAVQPAPVASSVINASVSEKPSKEDGAIKSIWERISTVLKNIWCAVFPSSKEEEKEKVPVSTFGRMQKYLAATCNAQPQAQIRAQMTQSLYMQSASDLELARLCDEAPRSMEEIAALKPEQAAYYIGRIQNLPPQIRQAVLGTYINISCKQENIINPYNLPLWIQACRIVAMCQEGVFYSNMRAFQDANKQQVAPVVL